MSIEEFHIEVLEDGVQTTPAPGERAVQLVDALREDNMYIKNISFTEEEISALDNAIEATIPANVTLGVHSILEERMRRDKNHPELSQAQIDAYLEYRGLKTIDIPPRKLSGGYELVETYIPRGTILPVWSVRSDGAIVYRRRTWGTTSPANGWLDFAWFQVTSATDYTQVSPWGPR